MTSIFLLILAFIIGLAIFRKNKPNPIANWNTLINNFEFSTKEFYEMLSKELQSQGINEITFKEKEFAEGGILSGSRLYLRVSWREYNYDCCFAPFGNGCFVSWWLFEQKGSIESFVSRIPIIGQTLSDVWFPMTYYKADTGSMFSKYAHSSVLKVIDEITKESGVRALSEDERKPILADIFKR